VPVTVRIPTYLASFAGGRNLLAIDGSPATVAEALTELWKVYPGLRDIFVGDEAIRFADGLSTKVPADAEVLIVPAVSGG
jgi:molybdopterin converting factor small subunit